MHDAINSPTSVYNQIITENAPWCDIYRNVQHCNAINYAWAKNIACVHSEPPSQSRVFMDANNSRSGNSQIKQCWANDEQHAYSLTRSSNRANRYAPKEPLPHLACRRFSYFRHTYGIGRIARALPSENSRKFSNEQSHRLNYNSFNKLSYIKRLQISRYALILCLLIVVGWWACMCLRTHIHGIDRIKFATFFPVISDSE